MSWPLQFGHAVQGVGPAGTRVDTVMGPLDGPFGQLLAQRLTSNGQGVGPFLVHDHLKQPIRPWIVFNPSAPTEPNSNHHGATVGVAQAAVASTVRRLVLDGTVPRSIAMSAGIIANIWVDPAVGDVHRDALFVNVRDALDTALRRGVAGRPTIDDILAVAVDPDSPAP